MRLRKIRVQNYRSIIDTGEFEVERLKTILVGPNEAGKTAILQAIQQINPPEGSKKFNALRDYPRALYTRISRKEISPDDIPVVTAHFELESADIENMPEKIKGEKISYTVTRYLSNKATHSLVGVNNLKYSDIKNDLIRLTSYLDRECAEGTVKLHANSLNKITNDLSPSTNLWKNAFALQEWLENKLPLIDEEDEKEVSRWEELN
jgi:predicted ATP-binding protein involved in virulence